MKPSQLVLATLLAASVTTATMAQAPVAQQPLSRAEVVADLILYDEAGMRNAGREDGLNWNSPEYAVAQRRYQALRASSRYAMLVEQLSGPPVVGAKAGLR